MGLRKKNKQTRDHPIITRTIGYLGPTGDPGDPGIPCNIDLSSDLDYSTWTWIFPQYHDKRIIKKKQKKEVDAFIKRYLKENTPDVPWLKSDYFQSISSTAMSSPTGQLYFMDFPNIRGNNNNNP